MEKGSRLYLLLAVIMILAALADKIFYGRLFFIVWISYNFCLFFTIQWARNNHYNFRACLPGILLIIFAVSHFILPVEIFTLKLNLFYYQRIYHVCI